MEPAERLQALFAEAPERNETYLRVMEFCVSPGRRRRFGAAEGRGFGEVSQPLHRPAAVSERYLGHLEGAGGLLWDEGWILTEDGATFLEAHGCC